MTSKILQGTNILNIILVLLIIKYCKNKKNTFLILIFLLVLHLKPPVKVIWRVEFSCPYILQHAVLCLQNLNINKAGSILYVGWKHVNYEDMLTHLSLLLIIDSECKKVLSVSVLNSIYTSFAFTPQITS